MLVSIASASVGEYSGFLYFNFTQTNQKLTNTWTLVNTGTAPVSFNVVLPSYNASSMLIQTSVASGTIPANSDYPIQVSVTDLSPTSFNGFLSAAFQGSGNIAFHMNKQMYVNFVASTPSISTSSTTTSLTTTSTPSSVVASSPGEGSSSSQSESTAPSTTTVIRTTPLAQVNGSKQSTTVSVTTSLTQAAVTQGSSKSSSPPQNNTYSNILPDVGIGMAIVIVVALGIVVFKRGSRKFGNRKNPFNR